MASSTSVAPSRVALVIGSDESDLLSKFETGTFKRPHPIYKMHLDIGDAAILSTPEETQRLGEERYYWRIERKQLYKLSGSMEVSDLVASIKDGRLKNQPPRLKGSRLAEGSRLLIILEGPMKALNGDDNLVCGVYASTVRERICRLMVNDHIYIVNTTSHDDTARFLQAFAWEVSEYGDGEYDPPRASDAIDYMQPKKSASLTPGNGFILALESGVPSLGRKKAKAVAARYPTPNAMMRAYRRHRNEIDRMMMCVDIDGIGKKISTSIYYFFYGTEYDDGDSDGDDKVKIVAKEKPSKRKRPTTSRRTAVDVSGDSFTITLDDADDFSGVTL